MNAKLLKSVLLAAALGLLILWIMEFRRVGFGASYWLLLLSLCCVLIQQYVRLRALPDKPKSVSTSPRHPAKSTKSKKK